MSDYEAGDIFVDRGNGWEPLTMRFKKMTKSGPSIGLAIKECDLDKPLGIFDGSEIVPLDGPFLDFYLYSKRKETVRQKENDG